MEPLTEENQKLKETIKLLEKQTQRARHEQDLAESNARDLEHQKGTLSEQLAIAKEQLQSKFKELANASAQLKDASKHLEQLQKIFEQKKGTCDRQKRFA